MVVLFAWELGGGLGHLTRHLELAQTLAGRGHRVVFAVKGMQLAQAHLAPAGFQLVQSPQVGRPIPMDRPMFRYGDILDFHGMANKVSCTALLQAWKQLYTQYDVKLSSSTTHRLPILRPNA